MPEDGPHVLDGICAKRSEDWWPARRGDLVGSPTNTGVVKTQGQEDQQGFRMTSVKIPSFIQPGGGSVAI